MDVLFEHMSEPVVIYTPDFAVARINRAASDLLATDAASARGVTCQQLFRCAECPTDCGLKKELTEYNGSSLIAVQVKTADQAYSMRIAPFQCDSGQLGGFLAFVSGGESLSLENNERRLLVNALEQAGGNVSKAAKLLQITRDTLRYRMKRFGIQAEKRRR